MADRALVLMWDEPVRGREQRALEVFNEAVGMLGRRQQEGRIESFDVVMTAPNSDLAGFVVIKGSAEQIHALQMDEEFMSNTVQAQLNVEGIRHMAGWTNEGVASQMALYQEAISALPVS